MRFFVGLGLALLAATPACADTLTETVNFNLSTQNGPSNLYGPLFNNALGTLTGVSLNFSGLFSADVFIPGSNLPPRFESTLFGSWGGYTPGLTTDNLGQFTLTESGPNSNTYTGYQGFNFGGCVSDLGDYIQGSGNQADFLAELGLYEQIADAGAYDDNSNYAGKLTVTYTYAVPEPASLALLASAAALLIAFRIRFRCTDGHAPVI